MVNEELANLAEAMGFAAHDGDPRSVMAWGLAIASRCCEILTDEETGSRFCAEVLKMFDDVVARREAVIECALCGDEPGGKYSMTWYRRDKTGAVYCGACVAKMLAAPPYDEMRICDALEAMGLRLIDPDKN